MSPPSRAQTPFNLNHVLDEFDQAWQGEVRPDLNDYFLRAPLLHQQETLIELVKIDLEYCWRNQSRLSSARSPLPRQPRLEDYQRVYPELGPLGQLPLDLIVEEFRVRRLAGDFVEPEEYRLRFPEHERELYRLLKQTHRQLEADYSKLSWTSDSNLIVEPEVSYSEFLDRLSRTGILREARLNELRKRTGIRSRDLAVELVRDKMLSIFQADLLCTPHAIPLLLGEYLLVDRLGKGGMGIVYRASHRKMQRDVAIKILPETLASTPELVKRFEREAIAAARLIHENIVTAFDAGEFQGLHFLAMQYVDGIDFSSLHKKTGRLTEEEAISVLLQASRGLGYAHEQRVIHRDIKPSNMLVDRNGTVKLLDLGLARLEQTLSRATVRGLTEQLTETNMAMGTVDYMSPEQAANTKLADERSDIYSLGCTLHFLISGQPIFSGETTMAKIIAHREEPPPDLTAEYEISPELNTIFQKMVAKRPLDRYESTSELELELLKIRKETTPLGFQLRKRVATAIGTAEFSTEIPNENHHLSGDDEAWTGRQSSLLPEEVRRSGSDFIIGSQHLEIPNPDSRFKREGSRGATAIQRTGRDVRTDVRTGAESSGNPASHHRGDQETVIVHVGDTDSQLSVAASPRRLHKRIILALTLAVVSAALISTGWRAWKLKSEAEASLLQPVAFVDTAAALAERLGGQYDKQTGRLVLARSAVTDSDLRGLEDQHQLREIDLDSTRITHAGLMHLERLPQLQTLNLSGMQIDDNTFRNTPLPASLTSLDLSNTSISDATIQELVQLPELKRLNVSHTEITDQGLAAIGQMQWLEHLDLEETQVSNFGLMELVSHPHLAQLNLVGCRDVDNAGLRQISTCPNISVLYLGRTAITDAGLESLKSLNHLEQLWLEHTAVTPACIETLTAIPSLKWLSLVGTKFTQADRAKLEVKPPHCRFAI